MTLKRQVPGHIRPAAAPAQALPLPSPALWLWPSSVFISIILPTIMTYHDNFSLFASNSSVIYIYIYTHIFTYMYIIVYIYICIYIYMYMYAYVYIYICICINIGMVHAVLVRFRFSYIRVFSISGLQICIHLHVLSIAWCLHCRFAYRCGSCAPVVHTVQRTVLSDPGEKKVKRGQHRVWFSSLSRARPWRTTIGFGKGL